VHNFLLCRSWFVGEPSLATHGKGFAALHLIGRLGFGMHASHCLVCPVQAPIWRAAADLTAVKIQRLKFMDNDARLTSLPSLIDA